MSLARPLARPAPPPAGSAPARSRPLASGAGAQRGAQTRSASQAWILSTRPLGSRSGSAVKTCPRPEPRRSEAGRALLPPSPGPPGNHSRPVCWAQRPRPQRKSEAPVSPKPETRPGEASHGRTGQKLSSAAGEVGGGLEPAPRALPLRPPADWKRTRRRPGWGRGRAAPRGRRAGSAASCRGGGRAGAAGPRADRPPPWLAGRCSGRPPQRGRAGPGVRFRLVEAEGASITGPFPAGPQAGPRPCNERLWRRVALGLPRLLPSCVGVAAGTSSPQHTRSQLESTDPPPGPVRGHDTPGQAARKSASCSEGPQVSSAPALGGTCIRQQRHLFRPAGF